VHPPSLRTEQEAQLLEAARSAASMAYAPYSHFRVGAAMLLERGELVSAANVENASYSLGICAERAAVARAVALHGPAIRILAAAVANLNQASSPPCGACRQVLAEFMPQHGIVLFPENGSTVSRALAELLPHGFTLRHGD
jgi:homotetrameric cytidine deaminase